MIGTITKGPTRPIVRYHGGKWRLAPWIIGLMPEHRVYVEPYGGGGSVLLRKMRTYSEVYNDMSSDIVNVFTVARDHGDELVRRIRLTPYSRSEYALLYDLTDDPIENARRTIARSFMGFGSGSLTRSRGFRSNSNKTGTTPAHDWANYPRALLMIIERLQGVEIEHCDALECMSSHDSADALHYVDPPYVHSTRGSSSRDVYHFEMSVDDHCTMLAHVRELKGPVIVSGYDCALYNEYLSDWTKHTRLAYADGARPRTECLWINRRSHQRSMFT